MALTDALLVREAWEWYQAEPARRWRETGKHFGIPYEALRQWARMMELPSKEWGHAPRVRPVMTYERILQAYREGASVEQIAAEYDQFPGHILDVLRDAGEVCARCGILHARNAPFGVAMLASGERVCQECVEEAGYTVERWEREPVSVVKDAAELSDVYVWEAER